MKVESHNHPSAVEPFQGAATGVGGIVRDIFTMGARPICVASTRCASARLEGDEQRPPALPVRQRGRRHRPLRQLPGHPHRGRRDLLRDQLRGQLPGQRHVRRPDAHRPDRARQSPAGVGNHVVLIGSKTGRDGIGGASVLASQEFDETLEEKRPSVQVGDPFTEKKLIEACLELLHGKLVVSMQDLGAAGITSSSSRWRARAWSGSTCTRPRAAARGRHGALGDHDQREPGAHARHRRAGATWPT